MFNKQLDPKSPKHLRQHPMVKAWITNYRCAGSDHQDCHICSWPHAPVTMCGMGSVFGRVTLGGHRFYVDTSNVEYLVEFVAGLAANGFHWRNEWFWKRDGDDVVVSYIEAFNNCPSMKQLRIPVSEFASIVCAASTKGETSERYQATLAFLADREARRADLAPHIDALIHRIEAMVAMLKGEGASALLMEARALILALARQKDGEQ